MSRCIRLSDLTTVALMLAACGGGDAAGPGMGTLRVSVATTGALPDPDGYLIILNDTLPASVAPSGAVEFPGLRAGRQRFRIKEIQSNCYPDHYASDYDLAADDVAEVSIGVKCPTPISGNLTAWDYPSLDRTEWGLRRLVAPGNSVAMPYPPTAGDRPKLAPGGTRYAARDDGWGLTVRSVDGSDVVDLGALTGVEAGGPLVWSATGDRIAYGSRFGRDIALVNPDGSELRVLSYYSHWTPLDFSPDGRYLLVKRTDQPQGVTVEILERLDLHGTARLPLYTTSGTQRLWAASYSPDGATIVFGVSGNTSGTIFSVPAAGGSATPFATGLDGLIWELAWSRSGDTLAVLADSNYVRGVHLISTATRVRTSVPAGVVTNPWGVYWTP